MKKQQFLIYATILAISINLINGCAKRPKELSVSEIIFCSEEPTDTDWKVQPEAKYKVGDTVWMYLEVSNFEANKIDKSYEIDLTASLRLLDSNNNIILNEPNIMEIYTNRLKHVSDYMWFKPYIYRTDDFKPGRYIVNINVTDRISLQQKLVKEDFYIE